MSEFYPFYASRWDDGVQTLSRDAELALLKICNYACTFDEPMRDDERLLGALLRGSIRLARACKSELLRLGKIRIEGGRIHQVRADFELEKRAKLARNRAESGAKGGRNGVENSKKSKENNETDQAKSTEERREEKNIKTLSQERESLSPSLVEDAVAIWNEKAAASGFPIVQKITPQRRAALKARLKECGGLDGFKMALVLIDQSSFLKGETDHGFRMSFDSLVGMKFFTKLMEGGFSDYKRQPNRPGNGGRRSKTTNDYLDDYARENGLERNSEDPDDFDGPTLDSGDLPGLIEVP